MTADMTAPGRSNSGNSPYAEIPGLKAIYTSADEKPRPAPDEVMRTISACRTLNADVVAIELSDRTIIAAVNGYEDTYAAAVCDPGTHLPSVARGLQARLYQPSLYAGPTEFMPAARVCKAVSRWERQIAVLFGRQYAARLVAGAARGRDRGRMTIYDLEAVRRQLSASIGGCIELKSEK